MLYIFTYSALYNKQNYIDKSYNVNTKQSS